MADHRGYNSYRGRKPVGKIILAILLVLIILGSAGFIALQKYVVYDDSGKPRLELPGKSSPSASSPAESNSSAGDLEITVQEPEKAKLKLQGIQLGSDPAAWKAVVGGLTAAGQDTFCVTMKAADGRLQYQSAADGAPLSDTAAAASQVLPELLGGDLYAVARISCLRDTLYAKAHVEDAGLKNAGGYIFYDGSNENWLDPSKQGTRDYLCAIAKECAAMGFDEIVLTDLSYPTAGKLTKIHYGSGISAASLSAYKADQISACLSAIRDALKDSGVKLSLELPETVLTNNGVDDAAGIDLWHGLSSQVDHLYVPVTADKVDVLRQLMTNPDTLIPELSAAPAVPGDQPYLVMAS